VLHAPSRALLAALALSALPAAPPHAAAPPGAARATAPARARTVVQGRVLDPAGAPVAGATVQAAAARAVATTDAAGAYTLTLVRPAGGAAEARLVARRVGYEDATRTVALAGDTVRADFVLRPTELRLDAVVVTGAAGAQAGADARRAAPEAASPPPAPVGIVPRAAAPTSRGVATTLGDGAGGMRRGARPAPGAPGAYNTEAYARIYENPFVAPSVAPRSTFAVDVDHASYSNVRRFLSEGRLPPADAVRIEELVNYFTYDDPAPAGGRRSRSPPRWGARRGRPAPARARRAAGAAASHRGAPAEQPRLPHRRLGLDAAANRLPLVQQAFRLLVNELRPQDRVAVVVYAGAGGARAPVHAGEREGAHPRGARRLEAGGSTAGGAGLQLAYDVAREHHRAG
jgi:Ca-activated chloride channel family protein